MILAPPKRGGVSITIYRRSEWTTSFRSLACDAARNKEQADRDSLPLKNIPSSKN